MLSGMARQSIRRPRPTFGAIRTDTTQSERARFHGLQALASQHGRDSAWVAARVEDGSSVEAARAELDRWAAVRSDLASRLTAHPDGPIREPGHRVLCALHAFGRRDLAPAYASENQIDPVPAFGAPAESLRRLVGLQGSEATNELLMRACLGPATVALASGVPGSLPAADLGPAIRDAALAIIRHEWARHGMLWRVAAREVQTATLRETRVFVGASGSTQTSERREAAELRTYEGGEWPAADVTTAFRDGGKFKPTRQRIVNGGGVEYAAWFAAAVARAQQDLDEAAGAALASAAVPGVGPGSGTAWMEAHLTAALTAFHAQAVGGLRINTSRPILIIGEERRGVGYVVPPVASAAGDMRAQIDRVIVSPSMPAAAAVLVSQDFRPLVIGTLSASGLSAPGVRLGLEAAGEGDFGRVDADLMAALDGSWSDPAVVAVGGAGLGAVRLTAS